MITATVETKDSYLTHEYGVKSWLLTKDHKRIALLYLLPSVSSFSSAAFSPP